ncbi:MAG: DUF3842 family protein [Clostridia bacterium]|nr:DUF3842 family protein [Clostridia bacterium]
MKVVVIDAQGGGVGRMLVEQLKRALPRQPLLAVGANALATSAMLKAGADQAATGENAVRVAAADADLILAPIGLVLADAMLGEVTALMAAAVGGSRAHKILIPSGRCGVTVAGVERQSLSELIALAVQAAVEYIQRSETRP